jgi:hypothetical protein
MSDTTLVRSHWVAFGPAGALGSIDSVKGGFTFSLLGDTAPRGIYPTLAVAKSALHASLEHGAEWPEFKEH